MYQLESQNAALLTSIETLNETLITSKEKEEELQSIIQNSIIKINQLEDQLKLNENVLGEVF